MGSRRRRKIRERCCESQNHRCAYCGCDIRNGATLDHIKTQQRDGPTTYQNCVAACWDCNQKRGNQRPIRFFNKFYGTMVRT